MTATQEAVSSQSPLEETFKEEGLDTRLAWSRETDTSRGAGSLLVRPSQGSDFWQQTHTHVRHDNGHLLSALVEGEFDLRCELRAQLPNLYDHTGLMVYFSPDCWLKVGIELEAEGKPPVLACVATNHGYSDWSLRDFPASTSQAAFRVVREVGGSFLVYGAPQWEGQPPPDPREWPLIRMAQLSEDAGQPVRAGLLANCPTKAGMEVEFLSFSIR